MSDKRSNWDMCLLFAPKPLIQLQRKWIYHGCGPARSNFIKPGFLIKFCKNDLDMPWAFVARHLLHKLCDQNIPEYWINYKNYFHLTPFCPPLLPTLFPSVIFANHQIPLKESKTLVKLPMFKYILFAIFECPFQ